MRADLSNVRMAASSREPSERIAAQDLDIGPFQWLRKALNCRLAVAGPAFGVHEANDRFDRHCSMSVAEGSRNKTRQKVHVKVIPINSVCSCDACVPGIALPSYAGVHRGSGVGMRQ